MGERAIYGYPALLMKAEDAAAYLGISSDVVEFLPIKRVTIEDEPLYHRYNLEDLTGREIRSAHTLRNAKARSDKGWVRQTIPAATARAVFARDGEVCAYCRTTEGPFHLDHIRAVSKGGTNAETNLTVACNSCNTSKGDKDIDEWMERDFARTKRGPGNG